MPAATETRTPPRDCPGVAGPSRSRSQVLAIYGSSPPVNPATHAHARERLDDRGIHAARSCRPRRATDARAAIPLWARRGQQRPALNRIPSVLTFRQPYGAIVAMLDGPCDPGNPSAARPAGRRFPRSHGPSEGVVKDLKVNVLLLFDRTAVSIAFSFPPMPDRALPAAAMRALPSIEGALHRLLRSTWPPQAGVRRNQGLFEGEARSATAVFAFLAGWSLASGRHRGDGAISLISLARGAGG